MSLSERRKVNRKFVHLVPQVQVQHHADDIELVELEAATTRDENEARVIGFSDSPLLHRRTPLIELPSQSATPLTPMSASPGWLKTQRALRARRGAAAGEIGGSAAFLTMRKPGSVTSVDNYAAEIADAFEQDEVLMDDNPESEELRLVTLRELTEALGLKRNVKERIRRAVSLNSQKAPSGASKRFRYRVRAAITKMRKGASETVSSLELWYSTIKDIEGKFGSGVATYFRFLRSLILLNTVVLVLSLGFLVTPQLLDRYYQIEENVTVGGDSWTYVPTSHPYENNTNFTFGNLLTGEGWLTDTELFYGAYSNSTMSLVEGYHYQIPSAYFFTILTCFVFSIITLSVSLARSYRRNYIEMQKGLVNVYAHRIFCGWDFSIADAEVAQLRSQSIYNELRELLHEDAEAERDPPTRLRRWALLGVRVGVTVLVATLLLGSGILVWFLLQRQSIFNTNSLTKTPEEERQSAMMMSLIITCVMLVLPMIFSRLVALEKYANPRSAVVATLLRTFGLEVAIIGVLLAFWLQKAPNSPCWETSLGQEVYRLIIVDLFICLIGTSLAEFSRARLHRSIWPVIGAPEFDIARNTLNLIYNQTLFWVGFYFSPLLALLIVFKLLLTFYVKKLCVLHNCQPSPRSWRAAQTQTVFLALTFLAIVGVMVTLGYIITQVPPSKDCGPFRDFEFVYLVFKLTGDSTFKSIISFFLKPGIVAFLIITLCVLAYYMRAVARAQASMVELLRGMLLLEAEDKMFLQNTIRKATSANFFPHRSPLRSNRLKVQMQGVRRSM